MREMNLRDSNKELYMNRFDYGYVITTHKSQGSQAKKVTIFDESWFMRNDVSKRRWLYTAVTRAKEKLYLIGFKDDFFED